MGKRKKKSDEKMGDEVDLSTDESDEKETPKVKRSTKLNLGTIGIFEVVEGKQLPKGIPQKFYSSLEREGII